MRDIENIKFLDLQIDDRQKVEIDLFENVIKYLFKTDGNLA